MNIDKRTLREVAEKATPGPWKVFSDIDTKTFSIHTPRDKRCENVIKWGGFDCQPNAEANAEFIAAFNPKVALALLDENIQLQREKDAIEAVALALRDDMRQVREQLAAAEKLNAVQQRSLDHRKFLLLSADEVQRDFAEALGCAGDNESIMEAIDDMKQRIAELESRTVTVKLYDDFQLCHYGATDDYAKGYIDSQNNFTKWLAAAGIGVKQQKDSVDSDVGGRNQPGMVTAIYIGAGDFVKIKGQVFEVEETDFDDHDVTLWFVGGNALKCSAGCPVEVVSAPVAAGIKVKE
ncbi:TPA: ead/Ea22-like family protein [Salmonella enterica subsp. indica]|uniref:Ead/Ea22-like family protein n=1 Tax=Salmonella enterica subsp. arizonae TaxID=59203 RepID=A0A5Y2QQM3_SALER|nr:ead/Ea22-like family protein [Salmonella enterica subsp. arizonae]ECI9863290.1 ead/Ea22-like family protein [Salmonella enterica subsp. arizonae]HAE8197241.1 ead/Ea22-like family protein [Salmonella enterica subsp. indica serovar 41:b:1,7]HAU3218708.1 ead/Ea22-like family protein [Salmonella enterica subsp. indica]